MQSMKSAWRQTMAVVVVAVALLYAAPATVAAADSSSTSGVLPINSHPAGMTYGQWSAAWWQYAYSLPNSSSPLFDATGGRCAVGQPYIAHRKVFFLAGAVFGGEQSQSCTIPAGTMLFFPLLNIELDNGCPLVNPPLAVAQLRSAAQSAIDQVTNLHASIDGRAVENLPSYRVTSPVFSFTLPATGDNLCAAFSESNPSAVPGATVSPVVGDGYYLMLAPLPRGQHTIRFGGAVPSVFSLDVTYEVTVA
jgi:hypothetical protein